MFVVDVEQRDGWWVVTAAGEVDVASTPTLRSRVVEVVAAGGRQVRLDLTRVDFIDSFGLGVVVGALKRVRAHGGDLQVVAGPGPVRDVLGLTGLDRVLDLVDPVDPVDQIDGDVAVGEGPTR